LHGTLTIIINKKKFEITTLRKDHLTDGRHAKVEFTTDWEKDSLRRDLTINAIYADMEGKIFDPQNGMFDLKNGKVKFIGSSELRIQEDYLRILRYFRFFIQYSKNEHEKSVIQTVKKNINGLNKISNERLFDEVKKILSTKEVCNLFSNKYSKEIILQAFPQFKFHERLDIFNSLNKTLKENYDYKIILALLIIDKTDNYDFFCYKYKLPNHIKKLFKVISKNFKSLKDKNFYETKNIKKLIYFNDKEIVKNILLFAICVNKKLKEIDLEKLLIYVYTCKISIFPISGEDLKKQGYTSGPTLGNKLRLLEERWIENDFVIDNELLDKSSHKN
jgi:tRNA nucleotidyltransferase/poly(A) polymerase